MKGRCAGSAAARKFNDWARTIADRAIPDPEEPVVTSPADHRNGGLAPVGTPAKCETCAEGYVLVAVAVDATPDELDVSCPDCGGPVYVIDAELLDESESLETMPAGSPADLDGELPRCRVCGCTEDAACPGACWWVPDPELLGELCSACLPLVEADLSAAGNVVGVDEDLAELLEECGDCAASGGECDYHRIFAAGWDACAAFVARWVDRASGPGDATVPELAGRGGGG